MEELRTAIADITLLVGTCRTTRELRASASTAQGRAKWHWQYRATRSAAEAYVERLARGEAVCACRASADCAFPGVLEWAAAFETLLGPGAELDGWAVMSSDLARLGALAQKASALAGVESASATAKRARLVARTVRTAIAAYSRVGVRGNGLRALDKARRAATRTLGAGGKASKSVSAGAMRRPLRTLSEDWSVSSLLPMRWAPAASVEAPGLRLLLEQRH